MTLRGAAGGVDAVIKVGGGALRAGTASHEGGFDEATLGALGALGAALASAAERRRLVVVPGGWMFADLVRAADAALSLDASTAHWMAVLGMDQMAHLLATRIPGAALVLDERGVRSALDAGQLPVLAPYRWLRATDPLPHAWSVTSDSIAAWIAGALGAPRLVLVKPAPGPIAAVTDEYFAHALPATVRASVLSVARPPSAEALTRALEAVLADTPSPSPHSAR